MTTEDDNIDIRRYIGVFLSYWPLMILLPILGGMAGYFFSVAARTLYTKPKRPS